MIASGWLVVGCDRPGDVPPQSDAPKKTDAPAVEVLKEVGRSLDEIGERITKSGEAVVPTAEAKEETSTGEAVVSESSEGTSPPEPSKEGEPKPVPVAKAVEGRPGYVFSPFSGKVVDVRGIPKMTLVQDPDFPIEEKKYFRVPEMEETEAPTEMEKSPPEEAVGDAVVKRQGVR